MRLEPPFPPHGSLAGQVTDRIAVLCLLGCHLRHEDYVQNARTNTMGSYFYGVQYSSVFPLFHQTGKIHETYILQILEVVQTQVVSIRNMKNSRITASNTQRHVYPSLPTGSAIIIPFLSATLTVN